MASESGLRVEKQRSLIQKKIEVDKNSFLVALGKGAVNLSTLQLDDFYENVVEAFGSLGLGTKPEEIAGLLIMQSMMRAMKNLVEEYEVSLTEKPEDWKNFRKKLEYAIQKQDLVLNSDFFDNPEQLSLVTEIKTAFAEWLQAFVENPVDAENISGNFSAYFVDALNEEWLKNTQQYIVIQENLDTPFTRANKKQQQWLRYRAWLQKQIKEPMFAESFSLDEVYVPLRAYYERKINFDPETHSSIHRDQKSERVVGKLQESLEEWLQAKDKDDAIRLLTGGPGSGKSSFSKIFAAQQAAKGEVNLLFIPLHQFSHSDDLIKAIGEFAQTSCFLSHNPIERDNEDLRLLLIFDGLDELSMQGKIAENAAKDFVEAVRFLVNQFNTHRTRLQVIISGREVVVQANRNQRKPEQLLYLLPYYLSKAEIAGSAYVDDENLLVEDQRQLWWQNYGKAKRTSYGGLPTELDRDNLVDITAQPLLNYLIALSYERKKIEFTEDTNLNEIYGDLLERVHERGYEKHDYKPLEGIELDEFVGILEEISIACWHGNGRTTTIKEIETRCNISGLEQVLEKFQSSFEQNSKACITRLLAAFYFRESGGLRDKDKTFEFTHKSFGEYLTAKRIIEEVRELHEELETRKKKIRKRFDEMEALVRWAKLCGMSTMDEYLFEFILDEIELIYAKKPELVREWQLMLCRLIEVMLENGMPMEQLTPRPHFWEEKRQACNAEEALLVVLNACARNTQEISDINWNSTDAFGAWISRLQPQRTDKDNMLAFSCLGWLNLQECVLYFRDFYQANLEGAYLGWAILGWAILGKANLEGANLERANLEGANFKGANLEGAYLAGSDLAGANLWKANLEGANLEGAYLAWANLEGANLEGANLEGAYLAWANLEGANLEGANFERAILGKANLEGANLEGANLEGANLWKANLEGANLEGANFERAILERFIPEVKGFSLKSIDWQ